jgi:hypothetical protein
MADLRAGFRYLLARLLERSTWLGLVALATAAGVTLQPDQIEGVAAAGLTVGGLLAAFWPDAGSPSPRNLLARLRERSTWLGLTAIGTAIGVSTEPQALEAVVGTGVAVAALIAAFFPEPGTPPAAPVVLFALFLGGGLLGCVSYDATGYAALARAQLPATTVTGESCDAHRAAAARLRDSTGAAWALKVPLGTGLAVGSLAQEHEFQAKVCDALEARGPELDAEAEARAVDAWGRIWRGGLVLTQGGR